MDLTLSRDVQYSFEPTEPYYLTTGFRVVVTQQLRESIDVRATVGRDRLDYREEATSGVPNDTRTDRASVLGAGVGYRFQPNLRTGVDVEFAERTSDAPDRRVRSHARVRVDDLRILTHGVSDLPACRCVVQAPRAAAEYMVGPQDRLSIAVVDEPTLTKVVTVGSDGTFDYPYIGLVKAGGVSLRAIQQDITTRLKEKYPAQPAGVDRGRDAIAARSSTSGGR